MVRSRLTYANVVASIALFASLGGGAYAALKLPKNSVGPAQIRPNAVRSSDVKDGALRAKDFAASELPAGAPGAQGPKGDTGAPGANGTNGTNGTNGLNGTARAYGHVNADATVQAGKNVGTIDHVTGSGVYCIHIVGGVNLLTMGVIVSPELETGDTTLANNGGDDRTIVEWLDDNGDCTGDDVVEVRTAVQSFTAGMLDGNVTTDEGFFFAIP